MPYSFKICIALVLQACLLSACGSNDDASLDINYTEGKAANTIVAKIGDDVISKEELDYNLAFYSTNPNISSQAERLKVVEAMVADQVMYKKAVEAGFHASPQFIINQRKLLAYEYKKFIDQQVSATTTVTDADVTDYYHANVDTFTKPAMSRLAIYYRSNGKSNVKQSYTLEQISNAASYLKPGEGFGKYAASSDHQQTKHRQGKLPWVQADAQMAGLPADIFKQAQRLTMGEIATVTADTGVYLVRLIDQRSAIQEPLESVKVAIRKDLLTKRLEQTKQQLLLDAAAEYDIDIYTDKLGADKQPAANKKPTFGPPGFPVQ